MWVVTVRATTMDLEPFKVDCLRHQRRGKSISKDRKKGGEGRRKWKGEGGLCKHILSILLIFKINHFFTFHQWISDAHSLLGAHSAVDSNSLHPLISSFWTFTFINPY